MKSGDEHRMSITILPRMVMMMMMMMMRMMITAVPTSLIRKDEAEIAPTPEARSFSDCVTLSCGVKSINP